MSNLLAASCPCLPEQRYGSAPRDAPAPQHRSHEGRAVDCLRAAGLRPAKPFDARCIRHALAWHVPCPGASSRSPSGRSTTSVQRPCVVVVPATDEQAAASASSLVAAPQGPRV